MMADTLSNLVSIHKAALVTPKEVAERLSCCTATVLNLARKGKIPGRKISNGCRNYWRFDLEQVLKALES